MMNYGVLCAMLHATKTGDGLANWLASRVLYPLCNSDALPLWKQKHRKQPIYEEFCIPILNEPVSVQALWAPALLAMA